MGTETKQEICDDFRIVFKTIFGFVLLNSFLFFLIILNILNVFKKLFFEEIISNKADPKIVLAKCAVHQENTKRNCEQHKRTLEILVIQAIVEKQRVPQEKITGS